MSECKLMSGLFADVVQLVLGGVAVSTLVFKRYRERPRRPWRIWFMDVSKQGLGALFAHVLNLFLSTALSWNSSCSDEVGGASVPLRAGRVARVPAVPCPRPCPNNMLCGTRAC